MSRNPHPEVDVPRQLPLRSLARGVLRGFAPEGASRWRSTAAAFTSLAAVVATSLVTGPALAEPLFAPCALKRTDAHHSEGLDVWNAAYPRPTRPLDAVLVFLSFPDSRPRTTPAELTADYFPSTSRFFERASYGRFTLRPHPQRDWIRMPHASTSYAMRRDWNTARRAAYLRDAMGVADRQIDFSRYDIVYFVADPDAPGVDSDATKVVNLDTPLRADGKDIRRVVTVFEKHPPDRLVLAHETGHVFDLPDLYHRPSDGKGDWDTYVGDWDLMGSQFGLAPDLFGWHKWKLGWLEPRQVVCVGAHGSTRVTLEPLGAGPVSAGVGAAGAPGVGTAPEADPAGVSRGASGASGASESGVPRSDGRTPGPDSNGGEPGLKGAGAAVVGGGGPHAKAAGSGGTDAGPGTGAAGAGVEGAGAGRRTAGEGSRTAGSGAQVPGFGAQVPGSGPVPVGSGVPAFGSGRGTKLAVVRTGPDSALAFEARGSAGNDGTTCTQGILIYRVRSEAASGDGPIQVIDAHPHSESCWGESVYPPLADAPVGLGESFTVPGEKVRVEVEDWTAAGEWTVKITTG
ncbi:M6 family metalloprotease domain-containing protein [Streptomyces fagopyri]|uniref:M6 family metalloprotease domain-containing protein n=1 Tax=Streptomyces fagopyri TaxID=2662397 RepID=UPI00382610B1